jgi:isopentenyl diphosphate isomerase/L-lactate dehydrogenase-like FMN-dependent dehydrogenase
MTNRTLGAYNIHDLREMARRRLPRGVFEFVDRGTEDEVALRNNRAALERIRFRPRTLVDVSKRDQSITLFGRKQPMPIVVGPTGTAGLLSYGGEVAVARAAAAAGIPFTVATNAMTSMETIAAEAGGRLWFQLYMWADRSLTHQIVDRAKGVGFEALMLTVDGAAPSNREYNHRNGFEVPIQFNARNVADVLKRPGWLAGVFLRQLLTHGMPRFENYPPEVMHGLMTRKLKKTILKNDSMSFDDLRELRRRWPGLLMVKGVLHPQDAVKAADCGADAVIVSNHGGRNLDGSPAPIDALPEILDAAGKRLTVMVDSGMRRGADVVKALALGAAAVLIGRAPLYGVAAAGEAGATRAIDIFREEIGRVMALLGVNSVSELDRSYLQMPDGEALPAMREMQALRRIS